MTRTTRVGWRVRAHGGGRRPRGAWLRRVGGRLWAHAASRGGIVFVVASLAAGLSNFVFHVVLSRLLGPDGYGAFGALLNVTSVAAVPLGAISVTVAQSVARRTHPEDTPPLGRLLRLSVVAGLVAMGLWLAATPTIDRFFHLHTPDATVVLGLWLLPAVPGAVLEGVLLGQRRFRVAGVGQLGATVVRLASGIALVALGLGVVGGMAATVASGLVVVAVYAWALRGALLASGRFVPRVGDALLSVVALGGAALLTSIDAWLARHFLAPHAAGLFVAAATAGNIALFLPGAITLVYFPRLAASAGRGPEARQALARATGLVAVVGLGTAGVMALVPGLVVGVLFGPAFLGAEVAVGTVALADAGIAVASCLVYFQVARSSTLALTPWPTCVLALGLAAAFHGSIEVLALDMVVASGALVVGLGVPSVLAALRSLADDTASLERAAILLDPAEVDLTVVVPCHNVGAARLAAHLAQVAEVLDASGVSYEVVPVSDGSTDDSPDAFARLTSGSVRPIVWADNRGKGEALRAGLAVGRGRYLGFIDGDGDIAPTVLAHFVDLVRTEQPDVVVGSKRHPDAQVTYPALRRVYSVGYQTLTRVLFGLQVRDTQTGVKLVRRDVVAEVLPRMVEKRFAFDLELLAVALRLGYRQVAEVPVTIGERFPSTISPRAVWRMLQDTLAVFWRAHLLHFYDPPLVEPAGRLQPAWSWSDAPAGGTVRGGASADTVALLGEPVVVAAAGVDAYEHGVGTLPPGPGPSVPVVPAPGTPTPPAWASSGRRLRILVCNWRDLAHPHAGGAEVYTHRVAREWVRRGHEVTWFCAAVEGRPSMEVVDGITVVRRGGRTTVYREARHYWARQGAGRFDLVVDEVNTRPFEAARWAGDTPVVALVHQVAKEVWFHELPWPLALLGRFLLEPRWLRRLRQVPVLTVSESSAASLARYGVTDVTVVPEGIDSIVAPVLARDAVPTIVWVGRLARNKRPDHAIEAFRLVRRQVPDARLWVIGDGPMAAGLARHLPAGVELLGRLSEEEKRARLARAHCLVATSVREGWGLTVTEAAQVGTPAVAYDVDGLRDSVTASGGILVAPDPAALAHALAEHLPTWVDGELPRVEAGGVLPWAAVAGELLDQATGRILARRRAERRGEDVAVAWRRWVAPLAAWCDRRAWSVAGIAALVAVAPATEIGAGRFADGLAMGAVACLAVAVLGTWADAVRWPLLDADAPGEGRIAPNKPERVGAVPRARWRSSSVAALVAGAVMQPWVMHTAAGAARRGPAVGTRWLHGLASAFSPGRMGAPGALIDLLQAPVAVTGTLLHALGVSTTANQWLWCSVLLAAAAAALARLVTVLGLRPGAALCAGVVYAVSPYVVTMTAANLAYLAAMALVPAVVAWVFQAGERTPGRRPWWQVAWRVALVAVGSGVVATSPPLLVALLAAATGGLLTVGWLSGGAAMRRALRRGALAGGGALLGAAYWAVPFGLVVASSTVIAAARSRSWAWASTRSSLANTLWLSTPWNWADRAAFPDAAAFHVFPLVLWRYALPVAAFAVLGAARWQARHRLDQRRLRLVTAAGVVALATAVVATATRAPGHPILALLTALPGGWLFEDPARFLFVAAAAYAVLLAVGVDTWLARNPPSADTVAVPFRVPLALRMTAAVAGATLALVVPALSLLGSGPGVPATAGVVQGAPVGAVKGVALPARPADAAVPVPQAQLGIAGPARRSERRATPSTPSTLSTSSTPPDARLSTRVTAWWRRDPAHCRWPTPRACPSDDVSPGPAR